MDTTQPTPIQRAVKAAGGQTALARLIGCTQGLVWRYVNGLKIPPERCMVIERATGVRCEEIRSDIPWTRNPDGSISYSVTIPAPAATSEAA